MNLRVIGCNFRTAPVHVRERLALSAEQQTLALQEVTQSEGSEAVLLSTCNRVEFYIAQPIHSTEVTLPRVAELLGQFQGTDPQQLQSYLYEHPNENAIRHLAKVTASLDSLVLGEGQIAGQVKQAFEYSQKQGHTGPLLNALFPHTLRTAKRVRTETGISQGHVSVSSVAVDFVRQVFDHFSDKTILVIGAGKMARLTLKHLEELRPGKILVTNRSPEKAAEVAAMCGGQPWPWEQLDDGIIQADIVLSTTGAPEVIMPQARFAKNIQGKRSGGTLVILDIAVPRDFDPAIHDGERVFLFNIDDLTRIREQTLSQRQKHIAPAESIIHQEVKKFLEDWDRRKTGPIIHQLRTEVDRVRGEVVQPLLQKLNGKLSEADQEYIEGAFRLFQNKLLHSPIAAIQNASKVGDSRTLMDAIRKLFGLKE